LCTKNGVIKKTSLEAYSRPRQNGVNAITIREGDQLLEAKMTSGNHEIMLAIRSGKAIRFNENTVRAVGRTASGVRGISLAEGDEVIGMITVLDQLEDVMVVSENGYGKRSKIEDYRVTNRGGKGVKTINVTEKTGKLVAIKSVTDSDDLMIITENGMAIRLAVNSVRLMGRTAQGVKLINLRENSTIASVARVNKSDDNEEINDAVSDSVETDNIDINSEE